MLSGSATYVALSCETRWLQDFHFDCYCLVYVCAHRACDHACVMAFMTVERCVNCATQG
eukprot:m.26091 g.26091  ORF g.26091 m.26091 type:complete len:59 (-) comp15269_c0_seq2:189-365(-)